MNAEGAFTPVTFSLDADGIGWIVFGTAGGRPNVISPPTLEALSAAISEAERSAAKAVIVFSGQDRIFLAGADLKYLQTLSVDAAAEFSRSGHEVFSRLASLSIPVVAAINGACAGGGFELALACHWRIASDAAATRIGLPEVGLGTIPGWGGTVRLPRLIGPAAALDHLLAAQIVPALGALLTGLVDEIVPAAELKTRATELAREFAVAGRTPKRWTPLLPRPDYFAELRQTTRAKAGALVAAPSVAIDLVERGLDRDLSSAYEAEIKSFGELTGSVVCKNLIRVFFLREAAPKRTLAGWFPVAAESQPPLGRIGVVGAGVMGSGIAQLLVVRGHSVVLRDTQPDAIVRGLGAVRNLCEEAVRRGKLSAAESAAAQSRITATTNWEGFADCDLVIEAVAEDLEIKRKVFSELATLVRPDTLLASNSSALPIEESAGHIPFPERTLGLHFFNPVSRMPLVELVLGRRTGAEAAGRALALIKSLRKSPVICRSSPGLLVTRILFFYLNAAVKLWEEGVATESLDAALRGVGWPMGPLRLIDEVGLDVTDFICRELHQYFPNRFSASGVYGRMLAAHRLGRKNGTSSGFYRYASGQETANEAEIRALTGPVAERAIDPAEIARQLMGVMAHEARLCLDEGLVRSADEIDFALLSGAGFPALHGGIFAYARSALESVPLAAAASSHHEYD